MVVGSPVSGLIRGYGGLAGLVWGLGYWVDRLCGWVSFAWLSCDCLRLSDGWCGLGFGV